VLLRALLRGREDFMTNESSLLMKVTPHTLLQELRVHGWNWRSSGAVCSFFFGLISPIIGCIFTAMSWLTGPRWHGLPVQRCGTVLLFLTIPLLLFGGHCLDLMDQGNETSKRSPRD
jgi:hypothetical protein